MVASLQKHLMEECSRRLVGCEICGKLVEAHKLPLHMNKHKRDQRLGWEEQASPEYLPFQRIRHAPQRKQRVVRCEQCGISVPFVMYAMHVRHCTAGLRQPIAGAYSYASLCV